MSTFLLNVTKLVFNSLGLAAIFVALPVAAQPVSKGYVDGLTGDSVVGWACTQGVPESVDVHVYVGGYAGDYGALAAAGVANLASGPDVDIECESGYYFHRFSVSLSHAKRFGGQTIWVHGINNHGGISVPIWNSGVYTVPSPTGLPSAPANLSYNVIQDPHIGVEARQFSWDAVPGATHYLVSELRGDTANHTETMVASPVFAVYRPIGSPYRYMVAACSGPYVVYCGEYSYGIYF